MHARLYSRSRDQHGDYTIRSAAVENRMLHANLMALSVIERESWVIEIYIPGTGILDVFVLTTIAWRYTRCANMNFIRQGFRKLSSDRHTAVYRQTVRYKIDGIMSAPPRVLNNGVNVVFLRLYRSVGIGVDDKIHNTNGSETNRQTNCPSMQCRRQVANCWGTSDGKGAGIASVV